MPTILFLFGLRFYFYTRDHNPIHVHVESRYGEAKFEIENEIVLVYNHGLKVKDLRLAESVLEENKENFINEWRKIFKNGN
ncbi:MAG: DUF4160 domain-containing protein [Bacteroidales bacterium]|jgi:hypothetical protein|nr:DUF4160 domain-containing protein [Bacteroidales bacterium]